MKAKVECGIIIPTVKIMVGTKVTKAAAIALSARLSALYEETFDEGDLYSAIVIWLEAAGVTGDFSVEAPDILLYDANKRPIG